METLLQKAQRLGIQPMKEPKKGFFQNVMDSANKRADTVGNILGSKDKSIGAKARQIFGQGAGLGADVIGQGVGNIASAVTPDFIEKPVKALVEKGAAAIGSTDSVQSGISAYQTWAQKHPEAAAELGVLGNVANLGASITGVGAGAKQTLNVAGKGIAQAGKGIAKTANVAEKIGKYGASQTFGLNPDTVKSIVKNPELFSAKEIAAVDRDSIFNKVKNATDKRIAALGETGKEYNSIRKLQTPVTFEDRPVLKVLNKYGIHVSPEGKLVTTAESVPMSSGDIKEIEAFVKQYGGNELTPNGFLNARKALSNMSNYSQEKTDIAGKIARELRREYDTVGKKTIEGLADLDKRFAPEIQLLTKVKKAIFDKDGSIKSNAVSTIANLTGKGKEQVLQRIEKIVPGITKDVNILKSIEDIKVADGQKVGAYFRAGIGASAGFSTSGPIGALIGAVATSPQVGVALLRTYGKTRKISSNVINGITKKMQSGQKLVGDEIKIMSDALNEGANKLIERGKKIRPGMNIKDVSKYTPKKYTVLNADEKNIVKKEGLKNLTIVKNTNDNKYQLLYKDAGNGKPAVYDRAFTTFDEALKNAKLHDAGRTALDSSIANFKPMGGSKKGSPAVGETSLLNEAKRYKTPEEFVKNFDRYPGGVNKGEIKTPHAYLPIKDIYPGEHKYWADVKNMKGSKKRVEEIRDNFNVRKLDPILVRKYPKSDGFAVEDGHHRVQALIEASLMQGKSLTDKIPVFFDRDTLKKIWDKSHNRYKGNVIDTHVMKLGDEVKATTPYKGERVLTTKVLETLKGKTTVSKQQIFDETTRDTVKTPEKAIIRAVLESFPDKKIDVKEFAKKVKMELLPLKRVFPSATDKTGVNQYRRYEGVTLSDVIRGDVKKYNEVLYTSPITTKAGETHFRASSDAKKYFGHTRVEDMADDKTRRVIEVQSDLYQRGRLEEELYEPLDKLERLGYERNIDLDEYKKLNKKANEERTVIEKLKQYNNPTAHFRMVREEIARAAKDGKTKVQFPTGETAMKVEGLGAGSRNAWTINDGMTVVKPEYLKVGMEARNGNAGQWVITDVLGDGRFRAVDKSKYDKMVSDYVTDKNPHEAALKQFKSGNAGMSHTDTELFDISGVADQNNPIYKFYERDMQKYLDKFGAKKVTDDKGVTWFEVPIEKKWAKLPVEAFGVIGLVGLGGINAKMQQ